MNDPIVDEVRRTRDAIAAEFNYDLDAIYQDIKRQERLAGYNFVSGAANRPTLDESPSSPGAIVPPSGASSPFDGAQEPQL